MLQQILSFIIKHKFIVVFYLAIIIWVIVQRKKFEFQAKIIGLYRTKIGLKSMKKFAEKNSELIKILGYIGIGIAYIGMFFICYSLIAELVKAFTKPVVSQGVTLVLPGVNIPGIGVLPFWYWLISIFIIATIHESAHGIVALANGLKIKSTGIVLFGPILGAFVEPDEKKLRKSSDVKQYSVYSAGPVSNIVTAMIFLLAIIFIFTPIQSGYLYDAGITYERAVPGTPAELAGMQPKETITMIGNYSIKTFNDLAKTNVLLKPGDEVEIKTFNNTYVLTLAENPTDSSKPYIGISNLQEKKNLREELDSKQRKNYGLISWFSELLKWLYLLSLGIGLFNLLPLGPLDGGQMIRLSMSRIIKSRKKAMKVFLFISTLFLLVVLLLLFAPMITRLFAF